MTMSPRAREVMKLGSPVKASREAAGVGFGLGGVTGVAGGGVCGRGRRGERLMVSLPERPSQLAEGDSRTLFTINARMAFSQYHVPWGCLAGFKVPLYTTFTTERHGKVKENRSYADSNKTRTSRRTRGLEGPS